MAVLGSNVTSQPVQVETDTVRLQGNLSIPAEQYGVALFAHGSGSSRHSSRNRYVAQVLHDGGLATLLFDLLTEGEEQVDLQTRELRFDIPLLARRVEGAVDWLQHHPATQRLAIGIFGASTGAAAALIAAANRSDAVKAVVSRGGRPDLAGSALPHVQAPTLLIVGGNDIPVIALNREAQARMNNVAEMKIVPGATHLFAEPATLEQAAAWARDWFKRHLHA